MKSLVSCVVVVTFSARLAFGQPAGADLKSIARQSLAKLDGDFNVPGVREPVEIVRDKWGVTHIYAKNEVDLFFAQGYVAAQDRLWQLYMWRMEHEGRLAEILGPAGFERDRETRLLMFRETIWTSRQMQSGRLRKQNGDDCGGYPQAALRGAVVAIYRKTIVVSRITRQQMQKC